MASSVLRVLDVSLRLARAGRDHFATSEKMSTSFGLVHARLWHHHHPPRLGYLQVDRRGMYPHVDVILRESEQ